VAQGHGRAARDGQRSVLAVTVAVTVVVATPVACTVDGLALTATELTAVWVIGVEAVAAASASWAVTVQVPPVVLAV
jgi:hypothetical protein